MEIDTNQMLMDCCRCCSIKQDALIEMKVVRDENTEKLLIDCFISLTGLALEDLQYNTKICPTCQNELLKAHTFRENALQTHRKLQNQWLTQFSEESKPEMKFMNSPQFCKEEPLIKIETFGEDYLKNEQIVVESGLNRIKLPKNSNNSRSKRKMDQTINKNESNCRLKCDHCEKSFETKRYLSNHLLRKHFNNMKSHLCDNCGLKFLGISELRNHIRTTHTNELPYTCHLCPRSYRSLQSLKVHLTSHSDVRAFVCEGCSSSFKTRGALFNHRRLHQITNDPFICEICSSKFTTKLYYEKHLRSHSIEETVRCPQCNKCFKNQAIYKLHERTHTGEMFKCNVCPKEYNTKEKLSKHYLCTHSGQEKQFKCNLCSSAFFVNHKLNRHLRNVHKVVVTIDKRKIKKY